MSNENDTFGTFTVRQVNNEPAAAPPQPPLAVEQQAPPPPTPQEPSTGWGSGWVPMLIGFLAALALVVTTAAAVLWWSSNQPEEASPTSTVADTESGSDETENEELPVSTTAPDSATGDAEEADEDDGDSAEPEPAAAPALDGIDPLTGEPFPLALAGLSRSEIETLNYPHTLITADGQYILRGRVSSEEFAATAEATIGGLFGAENIVNEYEIQPGIPMYLDGPVFFQDVVLFELNGAEIDPEFFPLLDRVAAAMSISPTLSITVIGHTDASGSEDLNLALARRRARAVVDYWTDQGVPPERLSAEARGETFAMDDADESTAAIERRVDFQIEGVLPQFEVDG